MVSPTIVARIPASFHQSWELTMSITRQDVVILVEAELGKIKDPVVLTALQRILVEPEIREMDWNYGWEGQTYPCWVIARDQTVDTELVYCEYGFGPKAPWGLVFISYNSMGMDSGWFSTLEDAYCDSFMAGDLAIWNVIEVSDREQLRVISRSVIMDEAWSKIQELRQGVKPPETMRYRMVRRQPDNP
jgi:hypothetical protein